MKSYKQLAKELTTADTASTLDFLNACMSNSVKSGKLPIYPATAEGFESFQANVTDYFRYVAEANSKVESEQHIIPDVEGLAIYCGLDRSTLFIYQKRGGEWTRLISYAKSTIAYAKKQLALKGKIPPVMAIFDLVNNHDYLNTNSIQITTNTEESAQNSLENKLAESGLIWDEKLKEYVPAKE